MPGPVRPGWVGPGLVMAAKSMADRDRWAAAGALVGGARRRLSAGPGAREPEVGWTVNSGDERQPPPTWPPAEDWETAVSAGRRPRPSRRPTAAGRAG